LSNQIVAHRFKPSYLDYLAYLAYPKDKVWYIVLFVIGVIGFLLTSPEKFDMLGT
jgi:hypothetical protein